MPFEVPCILTSRGRGVLTDKGRGLTEKNILLTEEQSTATQSARHAFDSNFISSFFFSGLLSINKNSVLLIFFVDC